MSAKVLFQCYVISWKLVTGSIVNAENFPQSYANGEPEKRYEIFYRSAEPTTECVNPNTTAVGSQVGAAANNQNIGSSSKSDSTSATAGSAVVSSPDNSPSVSASKLYALVQHIYAAQARVQLEVNEIKKAQAVANSAQKSLDEAANNVRLVTAALQSAQQEVATAAVRAQTAQMQLAAHDQLLFAARQKVDALSSQMVGLQAEDGVNMPKNTINIQALLSQLNQPLPQSQTPTPVPAIDKALNGEEAKSGESKSGETKELADYDELDRDLFY
ncbi:uncharacterized protein LOC129912183 isoform X2 [Episyrphus balteatus]|uniref:uncharacterized protein LOC129912183 isoform X2 n=1 Tax=Episyrphus balteatus TaxID=286459 RepID=UPI002485EFA2|nr:uncharacterized protein LOC129912183 isoform X2 [Episyrphus balteatus]